MTSSNLEVISADLIDGMVGVLDLGADRRDLCAMEGREEIYGAFTGPINRLVGWNQQENPEHNVDLLHHRYQGGQEMTKTVIDVVVNALTRDTITDKELINKEGPLHRLRIAAPLRPGINGEPLAQTIEFSAIRAGHKEQKPEPGPLFKVGYVQRGLRSGDYLKAGFDWSYAMRGHMRRAFNLGMRVLIALDPDMLDTVQDEVGDLALSLD